MATPRRPDRPEPQFQVEDLFNPRRAKFLLWLNTAVKLSVLRLDHEVEALAASRLFGEEMTVRPEDTLRAAGISSERQGEVSAADVEPPGRALVMAAAKLVLLPAFAF